MPFRKAPAVLLLVPLLLAFPSPLLAGSVAAAYREEADQLIRAALASDDGLNVPVGELVTALLKFGLKAYEYGLLNLQPVQKTNTCTLEIGGQK